MNESLNVRFFIIYLKSKIYIVELFEKKMLNS